MSQMKYIKLILILSYFCLTAHAQQSKYEYDIDDNDNWKYFYDIGIEGGRYISTDNNIFNFNFFTTLTGSYFFSDKLGFRSGVSFISGMEGSDSYWKVPILFSIRSKTSQRGGGVVIGAARTEFNIGTSLGYISPKESITYRSQNGREVSVITNTVTSKFASSLDANVRLSFQFWRICLNGNMGINYLWTRNYNQHTFYHYAPNSEENIYPSWFWDVKVGASFRF